MKIRLANVSNSSSSSFVVPAKHYKSSFDLARHMIKQVEWGEKDEFLEMLDKYEADGVHPDHAVTFPSCNYDTFIYKMDDEYFIDTCNNESWEIPGAKYHDYDMSSHPRYEEFINQTLLYLRHDLFAKKSRSYNWCKESDHWTEFVVINGKPQCPICYKESLNDES